MTPLDQERRLALPVQILMRWAVVGAVIFTVNFDRVPGYLWIDVAIVVVTVMNGIQQWRLRSGKPIPIALPLTASAFDAFAIVWGVAIMSATGFDNPNFAFLYVSLLAFALVFPGRWSTVYTAITLGAYFSIVLTGATFDPSSRTDIEELVTRVVTLVVIVVIANIALEIERKRRARAVEQAVAAHAERQRLSEEIHDGVAQSVYMLMLNLETSAATLDREERDPTLASRLDTLARLARNTLMDTRNLLFDLTPVMEGRKDLRDLFDHQAREFSEIAGIPVRVAAVGEHKPLQPLAVSETYRVVQEALANVYKHAEAGSVELTLSYGEGEVMIEVADDGRGFIESDLDGSGRGLTNIRTRANRLGGSLDVVSAPGKGTLVRMTIPTGS